MKENEIIHIYVNGEIIAYVYQKSTNMGSLLAPHVSYLNYMSSDAMLDLLHGSAELLLELGLAKKQANTVIDMVQGLRKKKDVLMERYAWLHDTPQFREQVMGIICEYVLRDSECGRLNGFTFVKCESGESGGMIASSDSLCDPERSIVAPFYAGYHEGRQRDAKKEKR